MTNLVFASAHQLAQMIRERDVSAVEVLDAYLIQITKHNSKLNAICTLDEERAYQRAKLADEALARGENWFIIFATHSLLPLMWLATRRFYGVRRRRAIASYAS